MRNLSCWRPRGAVMLLHNVSQVWKGVYHFMEETIMTKQKATAILFSALVTICTGGAIVVAASVPSVPEGLKVPSTQMLAIKAHGIGVQIYECRENKSDPSKYGWVLKTPKADLFDNTNKQIGKHYAGPTWESSDGSIVVGEVVAPYNSPDINSIPWLLLRAKSNSGSGVFSRIVSIQRVDTSGGKAPEEGCGKEQIGKEIQVPYQAMYYFYTMNP
jgi:hypothetical protein